MTDRYLYGTAIPVLLDGGRSAGLIARKLYIRYGLDVHWFGERRHLLTAVYARRHAAPPFDPANDGVTVRLLQAFAKERRRSVGILALIPCSPEAKAFLERTKDRLETEYVLLDLPSPHENPLRGLVRRD